MAVLVDEHTRLAVAGITGREGSFHTLNNRRYGTNVVGGVTPGKGGQDVEGIPVFDTWEQAVDEVEPNAAMIFVPPRFAADSILEAAAAGVEEVRGRASRLRDDVERRHHEAGAVSEDADVAVELDVLQAFLARAALERVSLILIG